MRSFVPATHHCGNTSLRQTYLCRNTPRPQHTNQTTPYYEWLAQRIVDVYVGCTPEEMEIVETLGWGMGKPKSAG